MADLDQDHGLIDHERIRQVYRDHLARLDTRLRASSDRVERLRADAIALNNQVSLEAHFITELRTERERALHDARRAYPGEIFDF